MSGPTVVLASGSPRRRDLLREAGLNFTVSPASAPEIHDPVLGLAGLVMANARAKALEAAAQHPRSIVIGADTLVWLDGQPLGKPAGAEDAAEMLGRLSGRVHEVATGVHLLRLEPRVQVEFHEITRVRFRRLGADHIRAYLTRVDVLDKAGAYALQEHGEMLVESLEGSRSNVVGLPVERTLAALRRFDEPLG
ncbi:MAG: Maf family protein [Chthoniobacterales bacterium]